MIHWDLEIAHAAYIMKTIAYAKFGILAVLDKA